MKTLVAALILAAPLAHARECAPPPVQSTAQAVCYATIYAEKNRLSHGSSVQKRAKQGKDAWTVSFVDKRPNAPNSGWQVNVDRASGTVTRFTSYKKPER